MTEAELDALVAKMNGKPGDLLLLQLIRIKSYGMYLERFVSCSELSLA